ncbi:N-succinyl-L,L-diaminopimelate aminotransferase alternative [hydrothermal vent metagenome]|uniref:N-succinyl-L,L-diaminopimelate aminotransferase alternative n=1 Tax=hydrothermal vent metagenome TaxID=652676 RepID=A0A3B1EA10_9ZZZZ
MKLDIYPFAKLREVLSGINPNSEYDEIDLTIGEPKFGAPKFIQDILKNNTDSLGKYPKIAGNDILIKSILGFVKKRYDIDVKPEQLCTTLGTKEVCFNFPIYYLYDKQNPTLSFTNPFYPIYEGAGVVSKANIIYIDLNKENNFKPTLSTEDLEKTNLVILNFPNNPTSTILSMKELESWVNLALKYDFFLINDECYSEIYRDVPPPSLLQASLNIGNSKFKNIAVINSLSKRSSTPGIRSGYIIGDERVLVGYKKYRTFVGCAQPEPLQIASASAWSDEEHVREFRNFYNQNFKLAEEILNITVPKAGFFLWLYVGDDINFAKTLFQKESIKVLPGSFMGKNNAGKGFVRIALVYKSEIIKSALSRMSKYIP